MERRNQYVEAKAADQALHGIPQGQGPARDSARLRLEDAMPLIRKPVATVDAGNLCLAPGERAIVPARWDRKVPEENFWCEESSLSGVTVQAGLCAGNSREVMLCVINKSELEHTLERGLPLAEAHEWITRPKVFFGHLAVPPGRHESSLSRC